MNQQEFEIMEVKPINEGWYFVSMYQYNKDRPEYPDYIKDWMHFDGQKWEYEGYEGKCYVCFIYCIEREIV